MKNQKSQKEIALRSFFQLRNIKFKDAAQMLGTHPSAVGNLVAGRVPFGEKVAAKWQETFGLSAVWLMTGEGDMMYNEQTHPSIVNVVRSNFGDLSVAGNDVTNNSGNDDALKVILKQQEQMDRLLSLLEAAMETKQS